MAKDALVTDHASRDRRYAVIVCPHVWYSFSARQLRRLRQLVPGGDNLVLVDEPRGALDGIDSDRGLPVTASDMTKMGLPRPAEAQVIHPVPDQRGHVANVLTYKIGLLGCLNPISLFHRKLRRLPVTFYAQSLVSVPERKAQRMFRNQRVAAIDLTDDLERHRSPYFSTP